MDTQKAEALLDNLAKKQLAEMSKDDIARLLAGDWAETQSDGSVKVIPASEVYRRGPDSD